MPKVSIIVPVYKAEKYLHRCVDSILSQFFINWELILVDDGSPDRSGAICDEYAQKDDRIRVIHKENGGVSSARNVALDNMKGEWVMFVDADDWINIKCLQTCVDVVTKNNLDAVQFGFVMVFPDGSEKYICESNTDANNPEKYLKDNSYNVCVWGGLYKRSIIIENSLKFDESLKLAEDQLFVLSFIKHAKKLQYLAEPFYYYYQNPNSATHTQKSTELIKTCRALAEFSKDWPLSKNHIDTEILIFIVDLIKNADVSKSEITSLYRNAKIRTNNEQTGSCKLFNKIAKINPKLACLILSMYFKLKK